MICLVHAQEELEVPYDVKRYERDGFGAPQSLKDVQPFGSSPIITDDDLTLPESGAIMEYIIRKYGQGKISLPTEGKAMTDELYCALNVLEKSGAERKLIYQTLIPRKGR